MALTKRRQKISKAGGRVPAKGGRLVNRLIIRITGSKGQVLLRLAALCRKHGDKPVCELAEC